MSSSTSDDESSGRTVRQTLFDWKGRISVTGITGGVFVAMGLTTDNWRGHTLWPWVGVRAAWLEAHPWTVVTAVTFIITVGALWMALRHAKQLQRKIETLDGALGKVREDGQSLEDELRREIEEERDQADRQESSLREELTEVRERAVLETQELTDKLIDLADARSPDPDLGNLARIRTFDSQAERDLLISSVLRGAQKSIAVVGVVNEMIARLDEGFLTSFFGKGGVFRALFIDPDGQEVHVRQSLEVQFQPQRVNRLPANDFANRTRAAIERLRPYHEANQAAAQYRSGKAGSLEVRVYDRQPTLGLLLVDEKWALFHYYGLSSMGYQTPSFEIDARNQEDVEPILRYYSAEFKTLWELQESRNWDW